MSAIRLAHVQGGKTRDRPMNSPLLFTTLKEVTKVTSANAKTSVEAKRPESCAFPKKDAIKCDELKVDAPASSVRNKNRMSDVFVNRSCVIRIEQIRNPGK